MLPFVAVAPVAVFVVTPSARTDDNRFRLHDLDLSRQTYSPSCMIQLTLPDRTRVHDYLAHAFAGLELHYYMQILHKTSHNGR